MTRLKRRHSRIYSGDWVERDGVSCLTDVNVGQVETSDWRTKLCRVRWCNVVVENDVPWERLRVRNQGSNP
jgi:DNA mismatch repair protein MutH